jgi:hypothetical protein
VVLCKGLEADVECGDRCLVLKPFGRWANWTLRRIIRKRDGGLVGLEVHVVGWSEGGLFDTIIQCLLWNSRFLCSSMCKTVAIMCCVRIWNISRTPSNASINPKLQSYATT